MASNYKIATAHNVKGIEADTEEEVRAILASDQVDWRICIWDVTKEQAMRKGTFDKLTVFEPAVKHGGSGESMAYAWVPSQRNYTVRDKAAR